MGDEDVWHFAEVWVEANRARALILMRYLSTVGAALVRRWKQLLVAAADKATSGSLTGRTEMTARKKSRSLSQLTTTMNIADAKDAPVEDA